MPDREMLEFYSVRSVALVGFTSARMPALLPIRHRCPRAIAICLVIAALVLQAGCATLAPSAPSGTKPPVPANAEPPPPKVNLSGFPLPYRQGYADGCASVGGREQKDTARFGSDDNYRMGWMDGRSICGRK